MEKGVSLIGVACKGSILCNILQAAGICSLVDLVFERCRTARRFFCGTVCPEYKIILLRRYKVEVVEGDLFAGNPFLYSLV